MIEVIGWCGTVFLSGCGVPQTIAAFKDSRAATGITYFYLFGWIMGVICMSIYIHGTSVAHYPWPLQIANALSLTCAFMLLTLKRRAHAKG